MTGDYLNSCSQGECFYFIKLIIVSPKPLSMKLLSFYNSGLKSIPPDVVHFLKRAFLLFVGWKLLYHLVLFPGRILDRPLTSLTGNATVRMMRTFSAGQTISYDPIPSVVYIDHTKAIGIGDSCNGLELLILYVGFLFCIPAKLKKQIIFSVAGIIGIIFLNCLRCYGLAWLFYENYSLADFAHHYIFKMIIYGIIFYAWVFFTKKHSYVQ
jgi:exosortase/archaeosortase family protein